MQKENTNENAYFEDLPRMVGSFTKPDSPLHKKSAFSKLANGRLDATSPLRINMQYFAESGTGDSVSGNSDSADGANNNADNDTHSGQNNNAGDGSQNDVQTGGDNTPTTEAIEKLVQAKVDRITADLGKKNADLQKEINKLRKEKLTDEEVKQLEMAEKEQAMEDKEKALLERENRLIAINAIKEAGLDDGSTEALELVDFVIADNEENIKARAASLKSLIDKRVAAEVAKTFKQNGRIPNGGKQGKETTDKDTSLAEKLGKARAAQNKTANDVLKYYTGR